MDRVTAEHIQDMAKKSKRARATVPIAPHKGRRIASAKRRERKIKFAKKQKATRDRKKQNKSMYAMAQRAARFMLNPEPEHVRAHTAEDIEIVFEALSQGDTVRNKCRELGVHPGKLLMEVTADEQLHTRYARARMVQAHAFVEKSIDGLDELRAMDTTADGANVELGIYRHMHEVYKWTAGKFHPGAYGEKVTQVIEGNPDAPLETVATALTPEQAAERYAERLRRMREKK